HTNANGQSRSPLQTLNDNVAATWLQTQTTTTTTAKLNSKHGNQLQTPKLSDGSWYQLSVTNEGIYKIDAGQLSAAGITIPNDKTSTIKVFGNGGVELSELPSDAVNNELVEQPIDVRLDADGTVNSLVFYGASTRGFKYNTTDKQFEHYINHYSETNYYLLTW